MNPTDATVTPQDKACDIMMSAINQMGGVPDELLLASLFDGSFLAVATVLAGFAGALATMLSKKLGKEPAEVIAILREVTLP